MLETSALAELRRLFAGEGEALQERIRLQARQALTDLAQEIGAANGLELGQSLVEGPVPDATIAQAGRASADLLVVGARGTSFMRHWLLGATAERLLRKCPLPILVVKQPPREVYASVLVPVDFSPWSAGALGLALAVAPKAELILLHAYEAPFESKMRFAGVADDLVLRYRETARHEAQARLLELAAAAGIEPGRWRAVIVHGDAAPRILEQEEEQGADLIVLGKHGVGVAEDLLLGSVTKHVLAQARCDVLVAQR